MADAADRLVLCLELAGADVGRFRPLLERLAAEGVRFRTLAEFQAEEQQQHPDTWLARFTEMDNATRTSDPFAPRPPEEIARRLADLGPEPVGCIVADDGERLVGYTYFHRAAGAEGEEGEDPARARQGWTGVVPDWRRRGVATGLKVQGILLARRLGYARLVTEPRADNAASVRMSMAVGFRPCHPCGDDGPRDTDAG